MVADWGCLLMKVEVERRAVAVCWMCRWRAGLTLSRVDKMVA